MKPPIEILPGYLPDGSFVVEVDTDEGLVYFGPLYSKSEADAWLTHFIDTQARLIALSTPTFNRG